jgi:AraC family transcriptional regulator, positive regulator of tynA and feaB
MPQPARFEPSDRHPPKEDDLLPQSSQGSTVIDMTGMADLVRLCEFDLDEREPRWGQAVAQTLMPMSVQVDAATPPETGAVQRKSLGDLSLARWDCPRSRGVRRPADVRRGEPEIAVVLFATSGKEFLDNGQSRIVLTPARGLLVSSYQPFSFETGGGLQKLSLTVPRVVLDEVSPRLAIGSGMELDTSRPAVRLLRDFLLLVWSGAHRMTESETHAAQSAVLSLLSGAVGQGTPGDGGATAALRSKMDAWIDRNLASGQLTVSDLAAAHHVSERTVQRVFAHDGETVSSVVRRRRIAQARCELVRTSLPIASVAARAGYFDPSHFAREFRHFYGETPRQHRAHNARSVDAAR